MRKLYKTALSMIDIRPDGVLYKYSTSDHYADMIAQFLNVDAVFLRMTVSCKIFSTSSNAQVYHIGRDFLQALHKIDRAIPVDILPEKFCAYFSFADNVIYDESDAVEGGYVCIDRGSNLGMGEDLADKKVISFAYVCKQTSQDPPPCGSLTVPLDARKIADIAADVPTEDFFMSHETTNKDKRNDVFRALLNAVIYIHSDEPIVERSRPLDESGMSTKEHKKLGKIINACTIPVSFLYPKYIQKKYHVDSTWVDSFPRWQRCGPGLMNVKLVFVNAFERKFKTYSQVDLRT